MDFRLTASEVIGARNLGTHRVHGCQGIEHNLVVSFGHDMKRVGYSVVTHVLTHIHTRYT